MVQCNFAYGQEHILAYCERGAAAAVGGIPHGLLGFVQCLFSEVIVQTVHDARRSARLWWQVHGKCCGRQGRRDAIELEWRAFGAITLRGVDAELDMR